MRKVAYTLGIAVENIRGHRPGSIVSLVTVSLMLAIFGFFLLLYFNTTHFFRSLAQHLRATAYLKEGLSEERIMTIKRGIEEEEAVSRVVYVSKEEALALFQARFSGGEELVQALPENPLPASFGVDIKEGYQTPHQVTALIEKIAGMEGVEEVLYDTGRLRQVTELFERTRYVGLAVLLLVGGVAFAIISATIQLALSTRREEIAVMTLLGAGRWFISAPSIWEGGVIGFVGGGVSYLALGLFFLICRKQVPGFVFPSLSLSLLPFIGACMGCGGSLVSIRGALHKMRLVFLLVFVCMGEILSPFLASGGQESLSQRIGQEKKRLAQIRREISQKKREEQKNARQEISILSGLGEVDRQKERKRRELFLVGMKLKKKEEEIGALREREKRLRDQIEAHQGRIRKGVFHLYKETQQTDDLFYPDPGGGSSLQRVALLHRVVRMEKSLLKETEGEISSVKELDRGITAVRNQLLSTQNDVTSFLRDLAIQRRRKGQLLLRVRTEREVTQRAITELEEAAERLAALIHRLEQEKKREGERFSFAKARGNLMWPVEGEIVFPFGRQKHSVFDIEIFRKGIEIRSRMGGEIRAVHQGRVIYADWLKGYGMVIIIDHGESYYSIYAHASRIFVEQKDRVEGNQVIGIVGGVGSSQEGRLYFEIRHRGDPIDPLAWLKSKKRKVTENR